jgi:hypothetical protein
MEVSVKLVLFKFGLHCRNKIIREEADSSDGLHVGSTLCIGARLSGIGASVPISKSMRVLVRTFYPYPIAVMNQIELNITCHLFINGYRLAST